MKRCHLLFLMFFWTLSLFLSAQTPPPTTKQGSLEQKQPILFGTNMDVENSPTTKGAEMEPTAHQESTSTKKKKKKGEFAITPIPVVNPTIGNGAGLAALYAVHLGKGDSPPSTLGAGGFGTNNGSWGAALGGRLNLDNDRYRISVGGGGGQFNYNYFGTGSAAGSDGISIPLAQRSKAFLIEPKMRFLGVWYAGPRYHLITNKVSLNSSSFDPSKLPIPLPEGLRLQTAALGGRLQRDTSDSQFYPRHGSIIDVLGDLFGPRVGGGKTYQNVTAFYNKYFRLGTKDVVAIHASACLSTSEAPFYDLCQLGMSKDLRGYQVGQFRDNRMLVGQAEYRRELFWRVGVVAFAGAGAVAHSWGDFSNSPAEPGGGVGVRFVLAKQNYINLRFDQAWGINSKATYVSIGEAF